MGPRGIDEAFSQLGIGAYSQQLIGQELRVIHRHKDSGPTVLNCIHGSRHSCGYDWTAGRHGLENTDRYSLEARRKTVEIQGIQNLRDISSGSKKVHESADPKTLRLGL
jgi:hypothetical protein